MSNTVKTSGDSRQLILDAMMALKDGSLDISRGMAIISGLEAINKSIQDVVRLGQRKIFGGELVKEAS